MKPELHCMVNNHEIVKDDSGNDRCITCLENEITKLRAYVQRGSDLLFSKQENKTVSEFRANCEAVLKPNLLK